MRGRVHARGERLGAVLLAVLAVTLAGAAGASAQEARHSLRSSVTDENFYFVMADRFENGSTANDLGGLPPDRVVSGYDPTARGFYHGGDLRGIIRRLDYIEDLGTTSIWLTPSFKNRAVQRPVTPTTIGRLPRLLGHGLHADRPAPRHQRGPRGPGRAAAHERGMKVYFDIITNHTADVIEFAEGARAGLRLEGRGALPDRRRRAVRRPRLRRARARSRRSTRRSASRTRRCSRPAPTPRRPTGSTTSTLYHNRGDTTFTGEDSLTATSSASTTSSPSTRASSTG